MEHISAGGFVVEPGNLWRRRVMRHHLDDAPQIVSSNGEEVFVCPSAPPTRILVKSVPWYEDELASDDAWSRPAAMDRAGIQTQVLFPTFAWSLFQIQDEALRTDCIRSYNHWTFDLCATSPSRMFTAVLIPPGVDGPDELEKCLSSRTNVAVKSAVICVPDRKPPELDGLLKATKERGVSVVLVRPGGASPLGDASLFTKESAELAKEYSAKDVDLIVPHWQGGALLKLKGVAAN